MSTSEDIARQIEPAIQSAISDAALAFSQQAAPAASSCALQTKFLDNLVGKFRKRTGGESGKLPVHSGDRGQSEQEGSDEIALDFSAEDLTEAERYLVHGSETLSFEFAEEATWASLMAEAGFCAQEGNFF